jgi:hypothetical protein
VKRRQQQQRLLQVNLGIHNLQGLFVYSFFNFQPQQQQQQQQQQQPQPQRPQLLANVLVFARQSGLVGSQSFELGTWK